MIPTKDIFKTTEIRFFEYNNGIINTWEFHFIFHTL